MTRRPKIRTSLHCAALAACLLVIGCKGGRDESLVQVDVIGTAEQIADPLRDSNPPAAKAILGATAQGLLSYDANGDIVDALAESWIVEDGGQSYIFRLKRLAWPDGEPIKAEQVARLLRERMRANPMSMAGLRPEVRAMTDRVIEIRLNAALPSFLQLLAQPQFGIMARSGGTGPYRPLAGKVAIDLSPAAVALGAATEEEEADEPAAIDQRRLVARRAASALVRFTRGDADLVLGGRFQHLPLVQAAGLATTDLRIDPVSGLLGFGITGNSAFLRNLAVRDALARAVDRPALVSALSLPEWRTADHPLPAPLGLERQPSVPAWASRSMSERIASAREVIAAWVADNGDPPLLRVGLPEGPGASLLFVRLARDFAAIGVKIDRVGMNDTSDLKLIDEVAPFDQALWYLARLDCPAKLQCDEAASAFLADARRAEDPAEQARLLGEAEQRIVAYAGYIPLGQPIRWALASRRLNGFQLSPRGIHPLNRLVTIPN